ncbi:cercosporin toxin biosynthesis protein [Podospora didyma]|uniref:Cercosporin toxin biosynthesis protein n=1 Tax=Podospora didyma TaxID=330526 RepID=A0AAE0U0L5_9PEZI|nr:cercosporin toxin biosynthesis protein [Podospora didyma]
MGSAASPILIIGGGLGGLCLAQGLRQAGAPFHVYERDPDAAWRPQGYRLRLNGEGANALKEALTADLWERFQKTCSMTELGETDINAADGSILACRAGGSPTMKGLKPYTCDRKVLRDILLTGLDGSITYGKELIRYDVGEEDDGRPVVAHFKDGSSALGCFLIGADGKGSATRRQYLPDQCPLDTEGTCIYGKTLMTPDLIKSFPAHAMRWMTLVVDRTPITQRLDVDESAVTLLLEPIRFPKNKNTELDKYMPADYMYWVLIARTSMFELPAHVVHTSSCTGEDAAALSLRMTECWDASIRSLLLLQDTSQSSVLRVLTADPNMAPWKPSAKVTLIGDAIHSMSPAGGVGAVTALVDGANLAKVITKQGISVESIGEFEKSMREFAAMNIRRSYKGGKMLFGQRPFEECNQYREE